MDLLTLTLSKWFSAHKSAFFVWTTVILLASCSTTKSDKVVVPTQQQTDTFTVVESDLTAEQLIAQAQLDLAANNSSAALSALLKASALFIEQSNPHKALWLAQQLKPLALTANQGYQLNIIAAKSLLVLEKLPLALQALAQAEQLVENKQQRHSFAYYQTLASVQTQRNLAIAALDASLRAFDLNPAASDSDIEQLWQQLSRLAPWQQQQLAKMAAPNVNGWSQLLTLANKFGHDEARFKRYLKQWQRKFSSHPAQVVVNNLLQQPPMFSNQHHNIAVIIPLTGKQERAGKVAQQGILAAYQNDSDKTLHFIDATTTDMATLNATFAKLNIDYVIGPLLKENVNRYLAQTELSIPTLLLNLPSNQRLQPHQVALSMRPEDEAIQAATTLSRQKYQQPLILSQQDSASRRIANTFSQQWQHISAQTPEIVYFSNDAKMQQQIKAGLGVDASEQRTKELNRHIKYSIKSEFRNRRDIDMIYVVGLPLETKLLKPYIDVNISPFADLIPVYASSRSHSTQIDKSDNRDLSGLIFTEMPWQLDSKLQNKALLAQAKKLWPNRSSSLQTIFAMGFDSLALVDKISAMQDRIYVRHYGQTGILQLGEDNILTRSLIWGRYSRSKVQEIALD
ncbi:penicillin-binding protein activator [Colwellia chukchiensis]|nr:penicillin-binding protein activator [Colwellia chukchiensis]